MADSSRKKKYLPIHGVRSDPRALRRFRILFYSVRLVLYLDLVHGGGRWVGSETEVRWQRLSRKWRTLVAEGNIYRSAGVRSDPWVILWPCILAVGGE